MRQAMSATNDNTLHGESGTQIPRLSPITLDAVNASAVRMMLVDGVDPETIDVHDLLILLARVTESRFEDGDDRLVLSLVDLAAAALLWSETADGLAAMLDDSRDPSRRKAG